MKAIVVFFLMINFSSALVLEQTKAQVGDKLVSLVDIKNFQKREQLNLNLNSLLLNSLYKKPQNKDSFLFLLSELSNLSHYKKFSKQNKALNYLIIREIVLQKLENLEAKPMEKPDIAKTLKKKKARLSSVQFLSRLKKAGFPSLSDYQNFLIEEEKIERFLIRSLSPRVVLSPREIESAFYSIYKRSLFSDYEYDFYFVSFEEDKKDLVFNSLEKKEYLKDFKGWAKALDLSFKNSKLKSKEIGDSIKKELDRLSVSQVSPLLFINSSYYLLKLNWKEALIEVKDRDKKLQIEQELFQKKLLQELVSWIQNEKNQIFLKLSSL